MVSSSKCEQPRLLWWLLALPDGWLSSVLSESAFNVWSNVARVRFCFPFRVLPQRAFFARLTSAMKCLFVYWAEFAEGFLETRSRADNSDREAMLDWLMAWETPPRTKESSQLETTTEYELSTSGSWRRNKHQTSHDRAYAHKKTQKSDWVNPQPTKN